MSTLHEYLQAKAQSVALQSPVDWAAFIEAERHAYWQHLIAAEPDEAIRRHSLSAFDKAADSLRSKYPFARQPPPRERPERSPSVKRWGHDLLLVLLGAAIAVPGTLLANYLTSKYLPQTTNVSVENLGVQQLHAPHREFLFQHETASRAKRNGIIEVVYGMGVEPRAYGCKVTVSEPQLFSEVGFDDECRNVKFTFVDPQRLLSKDADLNVLYLAANIIVFSVEITSPAGKIWRGSQGIELVLAPKD